MQTSKNNLNKEQRRLRSALIVLGALVVFSALMYASQNVATITAGIDSIANSSGTAMIMQAVRALKKGHDKKDNSQQSGSTQTVSTPSVTVTPTPAITAPTTAATTSITTTSTPAPAATVTQPIVAATSSPSPAVVVTTTTTTTTTKVTSVTSPATPSTPPSTVSTTLTTSTTTSAMASTASLNYGFGISTGDTLLGLTSAQLNAEFNDFVNLGVGWVRMDFDWSYIQNDNSSTYAWSQYDQVIAAANAHHIKVLGILAYTPPWQRTAGCTNEDCSPMSDSAFGTFVTAAVSRYAPQGIHDWEIWNEPNNAIFWQPSADAAAYVQLLEAAYPAIKKADPTAIVISGGLAPESTSDGNIAPTDFLSLMYALGAKNYFDAVGFHPYSFPAQPSYFASWNSWSQISLTNPSIRSIMTANGDASKQVWLTEYGAPTGGPGVLATADNYFPGNPDHVTEAVQADIISQGITLKEAYSWAGPLFIYSYKDLGTSENTVENFFGILRNDGSQKPVYSIVKQLLSAGI